MEVDFNKKTVVTSSNTDIAVLAHEVLPHIGQNGSRLVAILIKEIVNPYWIVRGFTKEGQSIGSSYSICNEPPPKQIRKLLISRDIHGGLFSDISSEHSVRPQRIVGELEVTIYGHKVQSVKILE